MVIKKEGRRPNPDQFLISTKMDPNICGRCKRWTYQAIVIGFPIRVETTPLNLRQELALRLAGVRIFQTHPLADSGKALKIRRAHDIGKGYGYTIHAQHDCDRMDLSQYEPEVAPEKKPENQEPPF
jgi:hypothetical protein